jgi:hypothetical protein
MQRIRKHLTYANVMATVLTFIVLGGGTAWALSKNSVGSKQLKKNAVTTKKIKNGAVTGAKIANGAVTGSTINTSSLKVSVTQATGPPIPPTNPPNSVGGATAICPAGKKAIAGGGLSDKANDGAFIEDSRPVTGTTGGAPTQGGTFTGWRVVWNNFQGTTNKTPTVYVVCLG